MPSDSDPAALAASSVMVFTDLRDALPHWRALAAHAPVTPYQSPDWVVHWMETIGAAAGVVPFVVVAFGPDGRATALLPLGVKRRRGLAVGMFLGGKNSNFNMGLFRAGTTWTRPQIHALLRKGVDESGMRVDLFAFRNQPEAWAGARNPFSALARQPSPSFAYKAALDGDADAFFAARPSRDGRKKIRQKMKRLQALGSVSVIEALDEAGSAEILDAFMVQRRARNVTAGLPYDDLPALRRLLDRTVGSSGPIAFFGLRCGDRIVATLGGVHDADRFCGMLMSCLTEGEVARSSPGELLLVEVIRRQCEAGVRTFDLGVGEARYKAAYCTEVERLFDSFVPLTLQGHLVARAESVRLTVKRSIKQSAWAWPLAQRFRRAIRSAAR